MFYLKSFINCHDVQNYLFTKNFVNLFPLDYINKSMLCILVSKIVNKLYNSIVMGLQVGCRRDLVGLMGILNLTFNVIFNNNIDLPVLTLLYMN